MPDVLMYSRPRCGLCDRARALILVERARTPFEFHEVDVSGDDELERAYGVRVPVVLVDGQEVFEIDVQAERLREALAS